jgi:hypothetical protein
MAACAPPEVREGGPHGVHNAVEVHVDDVAPLLLRLILVAARHHVPRVGHGDVQAAQLGGGAVRRGLHRGQVAHVRAQLQRAPATGAHGRDRVAELRLGGGR